VPAEILLVGAGLVVLVVVMLSIVRIADDRRINRLWRSLQSEPSSETFAESMVANIPGPARRYFLHAIKAGTPLASSVIVQSTALIIGPDRKWRTVTGRTIFSPHNGFVSKYSLGRLLTRVTAVDHYANGLARKRFWLWGIVPVAKTTDQNLSKAAVGRLACLFFLLPSALLPERGVEWVALDDHSAAAAWTVHGERATLTLSLEPSGTVRQFAVLQWADPEKTGSFASIPYGGDVEEERTFGGYTIPSRTIGGWSFGTPRYSEFSRATVEKAEFR